MSRCTGFALGLGAAAALVASPARAHFILQAPASWAEQGPLGDPQKSGPCGQDDPGATAVPTGMVTSYAPGDTVTVTIGETVTHPGHYRAVLSTTGQAGLPADPQVTAGSTRLRIGGDPEPARLPGARRRDAGAHRRVQRGAVIHVQAAEQRDLHGQLRLAGRRVHVGTRAQQPGRLLLSPLREHHDPGGRRHGDRRCGWRCRRGGERDGLRMRLRGRPRSCFRAGSPRDAGARRRAPSPNALAALARSARVRLPEKT